MAVTDRGSAYEGFAALYDGTGNRDVIVAQGISTRVTLEYELVRQWQDACRKAHRATTLRGTPLGRLPELWPFDLLKRPLVEQAGEFVRQIAFQHYYPTKSIYEFEVWGPYAEKVGEPHDWTPEEDNPFIPNHEKRVATTAWLYQGDESPIRLGCAFFIRGVFTREARHGHVDEAKGLIVV